MSSTEQGEDEESHKGDGPCELEDDAPLTGEMEDDPNHEGAEKSLDACQAIADAWWDKIQHKRWYKYMWI